MKRASQALPSSENISATIAACKAKDTCAMALQLAAEFMYGSAVY